MFSGICCGKENAMDECVKIQTKIKDYIEGNLTPDELEEFVGHVNTCDECREELNIYYTLYLGLLQLDHDGEDVKELYDLDGALEEELYQSELLIRRRHFFRDFRYAVYTAAFWCIVAAVLLQIRIFLDLGIL